MRRIIVLAALALVAVVQPAAQSSSTPRVELGLNYSYSRAQVPSNSGRANMHGLQVFATANVNRWLGLMAELGTHYHCISGCWDPWGNRTDPDERNDSLSFMAGPHVRLPRHGRLSPWMHGLAGVARTSYTNMLNRPDMRATGYSAAARGGLDILLSRVTVRAIQIDYVRMPIPGGYSNDPRFGAGIVLRVGKRPSA